SSPTDTSSEGRGDRDESAILVSTVEPCGGSHRNDNGGRRVTAGTSCSAPRAVRLAAVGAAPGCDPARGRRACAGRNRTESGECNDLGAQRDRGDQAPDGRVAADQRPAVAAGRSRLSRRDPHLIPGQTGGSWGRAVRRKRAAGRPRKLGQSATGYC